MNSDEGIGPWLFLFVMLAAFVWLTMHILGCGAAALPAGASATVQGPAGVSATVHGPWIPAPASTTYVTIYGCPGVVDAGRN
jgi:hypothetical protein